MLTCEDGRLNLTISYKLLNVGKTPATRVTWFTNCVPMLPAYLPKDARSGNVCIPAPPPHTQLLEMCKELARVDDHLPNWGRLHFPGEEKGGYSTLQIEADRFIGPAAQSKDGSVLPLLFACANYGLTFDETFHQTAVVYGIFRRDPAAPWDYRHFRPDELPIQASDVIIAQYEPSSGVAS